LVQFLREPFLHARARASRLSGPPALPSLAAVLRSERPPAVAMAASAAGVGGHLVAVAAAEAAVAEPPGTAPVFSTVASPTAVAAGAAATPPLPPSEVMKREVSEAALHNPFQEKSGQEETEAYIGHYVDDPLADVLDWLGKTRYDERDTASGPQPLDLSTGCRPEDALDVSEESPHRGGPAHTHAPRQLRPKLEKPTPRFTAATSAPSLSVNAATSSPPNGPRLSSSGGSATAGRGIGGSGVDYGSNGSQGSAAMPAAGSGTSSSGGAGARGKPAAGGQSSLCPGGGGCPLGRSSTVLTRDLVEEEEEEWELRQRKSGSVGRLVVYNAGERPKEDVVLRGGGGRRHIVVAGVREGGQAARTGVRAGDRLVSIDGQKDFLGLPADVVRERLRAPTVLVFLGFVGKLQAEVRLTNSDHSCGISARREVCRGSTEAPLTLCEQRIFDAGLASLFLTVPDENGEGRSAAMHMDMNQNRQSPSSQAIFELPRSEAHGLVKRALRRLEVDEGGSGMGGGVPLPGLAVAPSGVLPMTPPHGSGPISPATLVDGPEPMQSALRPPGQPLPPSAATAASMAVAAVGNIHSDTLAARTAAEAEAGADLGGMEALLLNHRFQADGTFAAALRPAEADNGGIDRAVSHYHTQVV